MADTETLPELKEDNSLGKEKMSKPTILKSDLDKNNHSFENGDAAPIASQMNGDVIDEESELDNKSENIKNNSISNSDLSDGESVKKNSIVENGRTPNNCDDKSSNSDSISNNTDLVSKNSEKTENGSGDNSENVSNVKVENSKVENLSENSEEKSSDTTSTKLNNGADSEKDNSTSSDKETNSKESEESVDNVSISETKEPSEKEIKDDSNDKISSEETKNDSNDKDSSEDKVEAKPKSDDTEEESPGKKAKEKKTPKKREELKHAIVKRVTRSASGISKQIKYTEPDTKFDQVEEDDIKITKEVSKDEGSDIEMIEESDPLAISDADVKKAKEAKKETATFHDRLKTMKQKDLKGATVKGKDNSNVIIIDTNTLLKGQGPTPVHMSTPKAVLSHVAHTPPSAQHHTPVVTNIQSAIQAITGGNPATQGLQSAYLTAIQQVLAVQGSSQISNPHYIATLQQYYNTLGALQDEAYVIEAPSFIVPYVMEGNPKETIKDYLVRINKEQEEYEKKEKEKGKSKEEKKGNKEDSDKEKSKEEKEKESDKEKETVKENIKEEKETVKENIKEEKETVKENIKEEKETDKERKETDKEESKEEKETDKDTIKVDNEKEVEEKPEKKEEKMEVDEKTEEKKEEKEKMEDKKEENVEKMEVDKGEEKETEKEEAQSEDKKKETEDKPKEDVKVNGQTEHDDDNKENKDKKKELDEKEETKKKVTDQEIIEVETKPKEDLSHLGRWEGYYKSALGKFMLELGLSQAQEFIQSDLLKMQKKKVDKKTVQTKEELTSLKVLERQLKKTREKNEHLVVPLMMCKFCSYKTENQMVMGRHLESPHMMNYTYKCNFCEFETRGPQVILFHIEAEHNVRGRLERAPAFFQCPLCPFEDNNKSKMTRHSVSCAKKFKPEKNCDLIDWEPPAKIPKIPRGRTNAFGKNFESLRMANILPKNLGGLGMSLQNVLSSGLLGNVSSMAAAANSLAARGRGSLLYSNRGTPYLQGVSNAQQLNIANQVLQSVAQGAAGRSRLLANVSGTSGNLIPGLTASSSITIQSVQNKTGSTKSPQQPSISITPLPRAGGQASGKPVASASATSSRPAFVICEICDGYIKDLEQLRNHMNLIHKVKIHPKMIYNRPPLNCQKCQHRFFTDQGLERHLLGTHGLVTSSMQEAANKGKDAGRCPICGKVFQWKLLNHVSRDHKMTLKPAHLSYKCTVCTATFNMYRLFENHVYSAHSVVNKNKSSDSSAQAAAKKSSSTGGEAPLKINDEITIIPQPGTAKASSSKMETAATKAPIKKSESPSVSKEITITKVGSKPGTKRSGVEVISLDESPQKRPAEESPSSSPPKKRTRETATSKRARNSS